MSAGNRQHPFVSQQVFRQPLGPGRIGQAGIEHVLNRRIAARHRVAYHHAIRALVQVLRQVAFHQVDTCSLELGAHGRVYGGIRASDTKAHLSRQQGNATHKGAANTQNVNVPFRHVTRTRPKQSGQC